MIAGHFGFAAGVKSRERQVPLWSLMLATAWLDVIFIPLFALGVETLEFAPDAAPGYGAAIIHADYTHSLVGALILSAALGGAFAWRWGRGTGTVIALVAFSHWVLDLIVHRPDLPILPGNAGGLPLLGFGLWRYPGVTAFLELALVLGGAWLYWRAARAVAGPVRTGPADVAGALVAVSGLIVLALDFFGLVG
jgi:hypothetical protein